MYQRFSYLQQVARLTKNQGKTSEAKLVVCVKTVKSPWISLNSVKKFAYRIPAPMRMSRLLRLFNDDADNAALLSWFLLKIRSVRILDTILCVGSLVWLFSPSWDAVKLILLGCLSFRGHWPYLFRGDDRSCSELAPGLMFDNFLPILDAESLPFYPLVLKLVVCVWNHHELVWMVWKKVAKRIPRRSGCPDTGNIC